VNRSKLSRTLGLFAKRAIDVVVAGGGLLVLSPILGAAALAIYATMGRPIIFAHVRPGYRGKPFTLRKLRTMRPIPRVLHRLGVSCGGLASMSCPSFGMYSRGR
jgi:lipopolysaccharide/colanic/teichoic acid biosynthesis glycosyltransferase